VGGSGGTSGGGASGGGSSGLDAGAGSGGSSGATVSTATYTPPEVGDCIAVALVTPDPDACQATSGLGQLSVDGQNAGLTGSPATAAFLSFVLDNAFAGKQVTSVTLQMTVANETSANGNMSGEVWAVEPFTRPDLFTKVPAKQGSAPLAADQGAVVPLQVVSWPLPSDSVTANQSVYLGVFPLSTDGVDDYGKVSPAPPKLIVQYQ
jgi:hypothetical protein